MLLHLGKTLHESSKILIEHAQHVVWKQFKTQALWLCACYSRLGYDHRFEREKDLLVQMSRLWQPQRFDIIRQSLKDKSRLCLALPAAGCPVFCVTQNSGTSACITTFDHIGYLENCNELDVNNIALFLLQLKKTMVIGIDCYHDSSTKGRSVGGFVASMNQTLTK